MGWKYFNINKVQLIKDVKTVVDFAVGKKGKELFFFHIKVPDHERHIQRKEAVDDLFKYVKRMCRMHTGQTPKAIGYAAGKMYVSLNRDISPQTLRDFEQTMFYAGSLILESEKGK